MLLFISEMYYCEKMILRIESIIKFELIFKNDLQNIHSQPNKQFFHIRIINVDDIQHILLDVTSEVLLGRACTCACHQKR